MLISIDCKGFPAIKSFLQLLWKLLKIGKEEKRSKLDMRSWNSMGGIVNYNKKVAMSKNALVVFQRLGNVRPSVDFKSQTMF